MEEIFKTGYQWCLEAKIRILNLSEWKKGDNFKTSEASYFEELITSKTFYARADKCRVKTNSTPRKTDNFLNWRMYGLVPYNLSPIQQGIQFGHAVVEYGMDVIDIKPFETYYRKWAKNDKTFIILNGGTTNNNPTRLGSLNLHKEEFSKAGVLFAEFSEPDLGDQLTAFVFLVDERVWDRTLYPDFIPEDFPTTIKKPSEKQISILEERNHKNYLHWEESIGGEKNAFLRSYLRNLKLA